MRVLGEYAQGTGAPCADLAPLHDAILSRALTVLYENAAGGRGNLTAAHMGDLCDLVRRGRCAELSLPGSVTARIYNGEIAFFTENEAHKPEGDFVFPLTEGEHLFPEYGFGIGFFANQGKNIPFDKNIYKLAICTTLPFDTIQGKAFVRFRRPGDRYRFGGMTRSVKKILNEAKIPPEKRAVLPIFCDENGKMNRSILDVGGEALVVSQFTLLGDARHGRRPSFIGAARPEVAEPLCEALKRKIEAEGIHVETGRFQTHMMVDLVNDGPVTILLDSKKNF